MRFQRRSCSEPCRVAYFGIMTSMIYHICRSEEWAAAETAGRYQGSAQDRADGFIHFSGPDQVDASAAKHRAGQDGLVLLTGEATALGEALRWEPSRGGDVFPHPYGAMPLAAVRREDDLPRGRACRLHFHPLGSAPFHT